MIVSKLVLKNWRNFSTVDVPLAERVFIIGHNASGKSNLLDALRFLRDIARPGGGLQLALTQRGGLSKVRCLAVRKEPVVHVGVALGDTKDESGVPHLEAVYEHWRPGIVNNLPGLFFRTQR